MPNDGFRRFKAGGQLQSRRENRDSRRIAALATTAGLAFGLRETLNLFGEVTYWSPETLRDYAAVALTSAALLFLGGTLWALARAGKGDETTTGHVARFSRFSVYVAATAAVVVSASNFLEDYLRLRWFGATFVIGSIVLLLALLAATATRFAATPRNATAQAMLLLAITVGVGFLGLSMFVATAALLVVAGYHLKAAPKRPDRADLAPM